MCNKASIESALVELDYQPIWTNDSDTIQSTTPLIIPGVGSFKQAMDNIISLGLYDSLTKRWTNSSHDRDLKTVCICLGMQLLFSSSEEGGLSSGFNIIPGTVEKFPSSNVNQKLTHIGWSSIRSLPTQLSCYQYFVHSYFCKPSNNADVLFESTFSGFDFVSGVRSNGLIGLQFHPEKSGLTGLRLLGECLL